MGGWVGGWVGGWCKKVILDFYNGSFNNCLLEGSLGNQ